MLSDVIDDILERALDEDIGPGDVTTVATIEAQATTSGEFRAKESGILAGTTVASRVYAILSSEVTIDWKVSDGSTVVPGQILGRISGNARAILTGERTALNVLQRMSGIATVTARFVAAVRGTGTVILDTRKTAPGLRALDKMAVLAGGGANHRFGLYDMVLIKDNHIISAGGIVEAISRARAELADRRDDQTRIEIEARTLDEVREVVTHWDVHGDPDRIMLDNMVPKREDGSIDTSMLKEAAAIVGDRMETEASGNVTIDTVGEIAGAGINFISTGALTHSAPALDISLDLEPAN